MPDVRRELELLAAEVEFPATPELAAAVRRELPRAAPARRPTLRFFPRPVAIALLILLVAAGTVFAAVPSVRHAVLDFLHLHGATVERTTELPQAQPQPPAFGRRSDLAKAQASVSFRILLPTRYGNPDQVFLRSGVPGGEASLAYKRPKRLLVSEFRGDRDPDYVGKITGSGTTVRQLDVNGQPAIWIEGAPHFFFYRSPDGTQRSDTLRLAGNVLLLQRGPLLIRLEGAFGLREAVAIASSLR
jgi:hypothetical protein